MRKWLAKLEEGLLLLLPIVVFFSYLPIVRLGMNETMNFELSLPLLWLFLFGALSLRKIPIIWRKASFVQKIICLAFPCFATLSLLWTPNLLRGVLTIGIVWLILLSVLNILQMSLHRADILRLLRLHVYTAAAVGGVCILQCILDVCGVGREVTGLCAGCSYQTIGFPHPNGLAIEPQFLGNLMILPAVLSLLFVYKDIESKKGKTIIVCDLLLTCFIIIVLFLSFSRGAIYAFMLAVIYLICILCGKLRKFYTLYLIPLLIIAAGTTLLFQGLLAVVSPTNESFGQGIERAIEHMTLGAVSFEEEIKADSIFDGYIEESTEIRLNMNDVALRAWQKRPIPGTGIGGAGLALAETEASVGSKEIVQNEYLQILLELGVVGVMLGALWLGAVVRMAWKRPFLMAVVIAYLATLCFFSGLPNALHIYLLPPLLYLLFKRRYMIK